MKKMLEERYRLRIASLEAKRITPPNLPFDKEEELECVVLENFPPLKIRGGEREL